MSDPFSAMFLIGAGLSAATGATSIMGQMGQASAHEEANRRAAADAREARDANYDQLHHMYQQEQAAAEQQILENDIDALQATETANVAAGEAGVSGLSVDALLADMYGRQANFRDNVTQNLENKNQQLTFEAGNIDRNYRSTLANLTPAMRPDYLGTALSTGSGIFGAYKDHLKIKGNKPKPDPKGSNV